jgi:hypothetical protein
VCVLPVYRIPKPNIPDPGMVFYIQVKHMHTRIRNIWLRYSIYRLNTHIPGSGIFGLGILYTSKTHISVSGIFGLDILFTGKTHTCQDQEYLT